MCHTLIVLILATSSKIRILMIQVDRVNSLMTELAYVAIQESALFDEYESILSSIAELQVRKALCSKYQNVLAILLTFHTLL